MRKILFIVAGALICASILTIFITHAIIDPYIKSANFHAMLVEFCANNKENNKVYFIGDSLTGFGVNSNSINRKLISENIPFYVNNLQYRADCPFYRIIDLIPIADSKPKIVVFDSTYAWLIDWYPDFKIYAEDRFVPDADNIQWTPYSKSLFNDTQLNILRPDPLQLLIFKKRFIIPALTTHPEKTDFTGGWGKDNTSALKSDVDNLPEIVLSSTDNINKNAFRYMVKYLKDRGVHVIIINMPLNPYYVGHSVTNKTREIHAEFIKQLGCPYYDLVYLCSPKEFMDYRHVNKYGTLNITAKMAEIVAMEAKNVTI